MAILAMSEELPEAKVMLQYDLLTLADYSWMSAYQAAADKMVMWLEVLTSLSLIHILLQKKTQQILSLVGILLCFTHG
jgi:ABC-type uncharacterized transport system permease subunit